MRPVGLVAVALGLVVLTACSSPVTTAGARRLVADVPVPAGAALVSEDSEFGPILSRGVTSRAERVYAVPTPLDVACPTVLRLAMNAGYTAIRPDIGVDLPHVTDPDAACLADRERSSRDINGALTRDNLMLVFPRGADTRYQDDGIDLVITAPDPRGPYPAGSTLRVQN